MKFFLKILFFIFLLFNTSFAKVRIGVFPLDFRAPSNLEYLKDSLTHLVLNELSLSPQIEVFFIEGSSFDKKNVDYFLLLSVFITENRSYIDYRIFKKTPSKPYIFYKEECELSKIESTVASLSGKIRDKLYEDSIPFWSKINPFKNFKRTFLFSFLKEVFKEEKYRVEISVPPPTPPPFYNFPKAEEVYLKVSEALFSQPIKPVELNSPWKWF